MERKEIKVSELRPGDVLSENFKPGRTVVQVVPARQRGYLVARFTDGSQEGVGHKSTTTWVFR